MARSGNSSKPILRVMVGPNEAHARRFSGSLALQSEFIPWMDDSTESLLSILHRPLAQVGNQSRQRILNECGRFLDVLPPLKIMVFDDEDEPRARIVEIAKSLFVSVSLPADLAGRVCIHVPRKSVVDDFKKIDDVLKACEDLRSQAVREGVVILADTFAFPSMINGKPLKVLPNNPKLVNLSSYTLPTIFQHSPVLRIFDSCKEYRASNECQPLILPISRVWDQLEVKSIEQRLGLPLLPKVMFSLDPCLSEGFDRTLIYLLLIYDSYLRSNEGALVQEDAFQRHVIEAAKLSVQLLRSCTQAHPQLVQELVDNLWHDWSHCISDIKRVIDRIELGDAPNEVGNNISNLLLNFKSVIKDRTHQTLLAFQGEDETSLVDLAELLRDVVSSLQGRRRLYGGFSNCEFDLPSAPIVFRTNRTLLHGILYPLVENAYDAIDGVTSRKKWAPSLRCSLRVKRYTRQAETIVISIKDNGVGIPKSHHQTIFDQTFTTKGDGHGLGLNGVQDKMKHLQIVHRLFSQPGRGTRFELLLTRGRDNHAKVVGTHRGR